MAAEEARDWEIPEHAGEGGDDGLTARVTRLEETVAALSSSLEKLPPVFADMLGYLEEISKNTSGVREEIKQLSEGVKQSHGQLSTAISTVGENVNKGLAATDRRLAAIEEQTQTVAERTSRLEGIKGAIPLVAGVAAIGLSAVVAAFILANFTLK